MSESAFAGLVNKTLKSCREGQLLELATSPLAQSSLVSTCFLLDEPVTIDSRALALTAVFHWAVERLRPAGELQWTAYPWRIYLLLAFFYLQGWRVSELAEKMGVVEQTLYDTRSVAFNALAGVLRQELAASQDLPRRKQQYMGMRYAGLQPADQVVLRCVAIFRHPVDLALIEAILTRSEVDRKVNPVHPLTRLFDTHLLVSNDEQTIIMAHPEIRPYLLGLLSSGERRTWHEAAAGCSVEKGDYIDAAIHFRQAGMLRSAAALLVKHHQAIVDNMQREELRAMLAEFRSGDVSENNWVQMKIIAGGLAEMMKDVNTAAEEYGKALSAPDLETKALAYYRRARVLESKNLDEALVHYQYCLELLEQNNGLPALLARVYIDYAWIYIQERPDLPQAWNLLTRAAQLVEASDRETWSQLHNALGDWYYQNHQFKQAVEHHQKGWLAANEIQNVEFMLNSAHNLGTVYTEMGNYSHALEYLQQASRLAEQSGNRKMEAMVHKSLGACYFWLKDYAQAIEHDALALEIYIEMGNRNRQASACYDLAEAYAILGKITEAQKYYQEGFEIVMELGLERYQKSFKQLATLYRGLASPVGELSTRQHEILTHLRENHGLKSDDCAHLIGMSKEQAIRELNELVAKGMVTRQGKARSTRYYSVIE